MAVDRFVVFTYYLLPITYYLLFKKMPAKKPKSQYRTQIAVTCSIAQKQQIDKVLAKIPPRQKSKHMMGLIQRAINYHYTEYSDESYTHKSTIEFQISCLPAQKKAILDYCDRYLPSKKRSRWIVNTILNYQLIS